MFQMKEEYKIGVPHIDEQHAKLFEIGERAYKLFKGEYGADKFQCEVQIIKDLLEYAEVHFKDEEEYMKSIQYGKLYSHKIEHDEFKQKVREFDIAKMDENHDELIEEILQFVSKWLIFHIIHKDLLIVK